MFHHYPLSLYGEERLIDNTLCTYRGNLVPYLRNSTYSLAFCLHGHVRGLAPPSNAYKPQMSYPSTHMFLTNHGPKILQVLSSSSGVHSSIYVDSGTGGLDLCRK